jgi:hypothetical protein
VQPIVVPRPPFSLSTASLSRRLLILAGSTCIVHQYHQNSDKSITATNLAVYYEGKQNSNTLDDYRERPCNCKRKKKPDPESAVISFIGITKGKVSYPHPRSCRDIKFLQQ